MSLPVSALLRLYPASWRARYGDEFAALLEDCAPTPFMLADVLLGALDAHLTPFDTNGRIMRMISQPRRSAIMVFCAYIAFVVAGIAYNQSIEDDLTVLNTGHPDVAAAYYVVFGGSVVALLAVLVGGVPIALAALRRAFADRRFDIVALFAVPPVSLALWLGWTWALLNALKFQRPDTDTRNMLFFLSWAGLFLLAAIASTAAVSVAVWRAELSPRLYRFALWPAAIAVLGMIVMLGGVLAWGLFVQREVPSYLPRLTGPLGFPGGTGWLIQMGVMAVATIIAIAALLRGLRSPGNHQQAAAPGLA